LDKYISENDNNSFRFQFFVDSQDGIYLKKEFIFPYICYDEFHDFTTHNDNIFTYYLSTDGNQGFYYITFFIVKYLENINSTTQIPIYNYKIKLPLNSDYNTFKLKTIKAVKNTNIFVVILNEIAQFFLHNKGELINFFNLRIPILHVSILHNIINFIDFFVSENTFKLILSDNFNKIYLYHLNALPNKEFNLKNLFTLENIYENSFSSSLTDLRFLEINDSLKTFNNQTIQKQYFCASSKDGFIKIFDSHNPFEPVFKLKISEVWICNFHYENSNQTLFFTVNKDPKNKVQSIKFYEDKEKEPKFKRINDTENSVNCTYSTYLTKFFYLLDKGDLFSIEEFHLSGLYKRTKSKKQENINKLEFSFSDYSSKNKLSFNDNLLPKQFCVLTNIIGKSILVIFNQLYIVYKPIN